jgi:hypothetical protein
MYNELFQRLQAYASRNDLRLTEKLGFGIHGLVYLAEKTDKPHAAVKIHKHKARRFTAIPLTDPLRQSHPEFGALSRFAGYFDMAAVGFDECFDKAQSEAKTALGAALVAAIEAVPDFGEFVGRDAHAGVAEDYLCLGRGSKIG